MFKYNEFSMDDGIYYKVMMRWEFKLQTYFWRIEVIKDVSIFWIIVKFLDLQTLIKFDHLNNLV